MTIAKKKEKSEKNIETEKTFGHNTVNSVGESLQMKIGQLFPLFCLFSLKEKNERNENKKHNKNELFSMFFHNFERG